MRRKKKRELKEEKGKKRKMKRLSQRYWLVWKGNLVI